VRIRFARVRIQTEDRNMQEWMYPVAGLDHIVLLGAIYTVLRTEQGFEAAREGFVDEIGSRS